MQLTKWAPRHRIFDRHNFFPGLMDEFFAPIAGDRTLESSSFLPSVDIYEKDNTVVFEAELPGFSKEDINVDIKGKLVTFSGERSEEKNDEQNSYRRERRYGRFERSFQLGFDADSESVRASYENGILTVEIPKPQELKVKQIEIN